MEGGFHEEKKWIVKPSIKCAPLLLIAVLLFGCAPVQVPGETLANSELKRDTTNLIKLMERAFYRCSTLKLTVSGTKKITPFDGKKWQEKWDILSCNGENHVYDIKFTRSPRGGTNITIKRPTLR